MKRLRKKFNTRLGFIIGFVLVVLTALALPYLLAGVGISLAALFVSTIIDQASGKLGDNVLSRNKAGNYIKKHRKPSNPKSDSQMNIRQWHQYLAKAWSSILSAGDRLAFDNYATAHPVPNKFGTKMERSGFQAFMRLNSKYGAIETAGIFNLPPTLPTAWPIINWGAGAFASPEAFALTPIIGEGTCLI